MSDDRNFIYANSTHEVGKPAGVAGYVIKFSPERLEDLVEELNAQVDSELGVTLFMNIFENDAEDKKTGEKYTYLSTSLNAIPTEEGGPKFKSNESKKSAARGRIAKAAKSVSRTSRRQSRR